MSDRSKHTPGPWIAQPQPGQTPRHYYTHMVFDPTGNTIASLLTVADARLIAAAPELLAACLAALDEAGHGEDCLLHDYSRPHEGPRHCDCWMSQAEAAIAKAEGSET